MRRQIFRLHDALVGIWLGNLWTKGRIDEVIERRTLHGEMTY